MCVCVCIRVPWGMVRSELHAGMCVSAQQHMWQGDRNLPVWTRILWSSVWAWWVSFCLSHTHTLLTLRHVINHLSSSSLFLLFSVRVRVYVCVTACPVGLYGPRCQQHCECVNGALCHPSNGHCICPAGYQGSHCQKGNYMVTHTHTHTRSENKCVLYLNHFHCPDTKCRSSTINMDKCPCPSTVTYHNKSHTYILI